MSQLLDSFNTLAGDPAFLAGPGDPIPDYEPEVPAELEKSTSTVLGWTAGGGLVLAVLGGLVGWALVGIGHNSQRPELASRGKQSILWSLIAGGGIGVTSGLIMGFYNTVAGG